MITKFTSRLFLSATLLGFLLPGKMIAADGNKGVNEVVNEKSGTSVFQIKNPDYSASPLTGMTRKHWKDADLYLLKGAFSYIHSMNDPMKFPKLPGKSYPREERQVPTEKLEGLCRTLFMAAPLLKEDTGLTINGIRLADYYRHQIVGLSDPKFANYVARRAKNGGPSQILVEYGALAISLFAIPEVIWEPLSQTEKDALAASMLSYGDGPTVSSNWRFFNIFILSFFKSQGYTVNEKLLNQYLEQSLAQYRGDGWYNDSPAYDYYSMWAFQLYGKLWSHYYGDKYLPEVAGRFEANFRDLNNGYPYQFSRDGKMIMLGRSISYRFAAIAPLAFMGTENDPKINLGWMRRIASSTILQFVQHPDFLKDSIPTLGFYGAFEPAVQNYSCRGSVFWLAKAFLGLLLPADNPFWTAKENEGAWDEFEKDKVYNRFAKGSNTLVTDYPNIGASEVRAWCHEKVKDDWQGFRSTENYNRLAYNSAFLWQADGANGEVAMNYVVKNKDNKWEALRLYDFKKFEEGIYYRDAVLETNDSVRFLLADVPLANGILRVDRMVGTVPSEIRLGHYALPEFATPIKEERRKVKGHEVRIISNGKYQLALVALNGWEAMETLHTEGLHPESNKSAVLNVAAKYTPGARNKGVYATLMLWKKAGETFTDKELLPVRKLKISRDGNVIRVIFADGSSKLVAF